jgi:hypothetical protein
MELPWVFFSKGAAGMDNTPANRTAIDSKHFPNNFHRKSPSLLAIRFEA